MNSEFYYNWIYFFALSLLEILFKIKSISYINPIVTTLFNNNLLIIHKEGIDVCDQRFNKIKESINFISSDEQITIDTLSKISISKFTNEEIICLINDKIYYFDKFGNCLIEEKKNLPIKYYSYSNYCLLAAELKENYYYFYIGYISNSNLFIIFILIENFFLLIRPLQEVIIYLKKTI